MAEGERKRTGDAREKEGGTGRTGCEEDVGRCAGRQACQ